MEFLAVVFQQETCTPSVHAHAGRIQINAAGLANARRKLGRYTA